MKFKIVTGYIDELNGTDTIDALVNSFLQKMQPNEIVSVSVSSGSNKVSAYQYRPFVTIVIFYK